MTHILGAVLAGGGARRFGSDKALALLDGKPLIAHVIAALEAQTQGVIICGRTWEGAMALPDRPAPDLGPLGGLNAALHHALAQGYDAVLTAGCDTPHLPTDLLAQLNALPSPAIVTALPIIGLWPAALAPALDRHLAQGDDRSMRGWARATGARGIALAQGIANINTPQDLRDLSHGKG